MTLATVAGMNGRIASVTVENVVTSSDESDDGPLSEPSESDPKVRLCSKITSVFSELQNRNIGAYTERQIMDNQHN